MRRGLDEKEIAILECLKNADTPLGSWNLVDKLERKNIYVSSATIGRLLSSLESAGLVRKDGYSGRMITQRGRETLSCAKVNDCIMEHSPMLEQIIVASTLDDYLLVLEARKAIERETARLAARNVTEAELEEIKEILSQQQRIHNADGYVSDVDIRFHKAIARASRNRVLELLYHMLFPYGQQTHLFEYIRKQVKAPYMSWHTKIYEALLAHDELAAEQAMVSHMDSLMHDVKKYWDRFDGADERGAISKA